MYNQEIVIVQASEKDIDAIMKIEFDAFSEEIREKAEVFVERIRIFPEGFLVLKKDDEIIGYISSEIWNYNEQVRSEAFTLGHSILEAHQEQGQELYISSMGLLRSERQMGLGNKIFTHLINHVKKQYPQIESHLLLVASSWENARKIYSKNGFVEIFTIENFFGSEDGIPINGIVMRRRW